MKLPRGLLTGLTLSLALHGALFWPTVSARPAAVTLQEGRRAVVVNLAPSRAAPAPPVVHEPVAPQPVPVPDVVEVIQEQPVLPVPSEILEEVPDALPPPAVDAPVEVASVEPAPVPVQDVDGSLEDKGVEVVAELIGACRPEYPRLSRRLGESGVVAVEVHISADGQAQDMRVTRSSGHKRLDRAAMTALRSAVFRPATHRGVAIGAVREFEFAFELDGVSR